MQDIDDLTTKASIFLEKNNISGDSMAYFNHNLDDLEEEARDGSLFLNDLLAGFVVEICQTAPPNYTLEPTSAIQTPDWICKECSAPNIPVNTICWHCNAASL